MRAPAAMAVGSALLLAATLLAGCTASDPGTTLRLGYFPNVTHAQALYGLEKGIYASHLGAGNLTTMAFNAGPTAMEALLTHQIDAAYVGPGPVLNAWARSGDTVRVIAGAASGGARFIVQSTFALAKDADLAGRTFASPQLGNTQDLSLKAYLKAHGHTTDDRGGDVKVVNAANADILTLFAQKQIDGAWVPEPWATRLVHDGGGREFLDERSLWPGGQFASTVLVTTGAYMSRHPDRIEALLAAHVESTDAVQKGDPAVLQAINAGIEHATGKALGDDLLTESFTKLNFTYDPLAPTIVAFGDKARNLGILTGNLPGIGQVVSLGPLDAVLSHLGRAGVPQP